MANVRGTTSQTIVSILGSINSAATMVAKTVDSATSSVDMLDRYVQRAKTNQIAAHAVEDAHWRRNLILDAAKTQEKIETDLIKEYSGDAIRGSKFNSIVSELEALFITPNA